MNIFDTAQKVKSRTNITYELIYNLAMLVLLALADIFTNNFTK